MSTHRKAQTIVETGRLVLCPMVVRHRKGVVRALGHYDVARFLSSVAHPYPPKDFDRFLARSKVQKANGRMHQFAIENNRGAFVGSVTLFRRGRGGWELAYYITPGQSGKGYVTEAAHALVAYGFYTLGFRRIKAGHHIDNPASARVLAKLGFAKTHQEMRLCLARGRKVRCNELILTRSAFKAAQP